jgi:hypothetical protein
VIHVRDDGDIPNVLHNFSNQLHRMPFWGERSSCVCRKIDCCASAESIKSGILTFE